MNLTILIVLLFLTTLTVNPVYIFFFNDTATTEIYTLSLHDALPIFSAEWRSRHGRAGRRRHPVGSQLLHRDRKSTRLNSSHSQISYGVFCLKKKKYTDGTCIPPHCRVLWNTDLRAYFAGRPFGSGMA